MKRAEKNALGMKGIQVGTCAERLARLVTAGALVVSLGLPAVALADVTGQDVTYPDATTTIQATDANAAPNTYKAYKVFNALVDSSDNATYVEWASDAAKSTVMGFLNTGTNYSSWLASNGYSDGTLPQVAAEYISQAIRTGGYDADFNSGSNSGTNHYPSPAGTSFATQLAQALASSSTSSATATAGSAFTGTEGFYLFVANDAGVSADEAATAPIWLPLGGSAGTVVEKNAIPTIDKQIQEDRDGSWGKIADANKNQDVNVRLTATMPENVGSFESYHVKFTDTLSNAVKLKDENAGSVAVKVWPTGASGSSVAVPTTNAHLGIDYAGNVLTVNIDDVKALGQSITKDSLVTVEYKAHMAGDAAEGAGGNASSATLTYTADPVSLADKTTTSKAVALAAYRIDITKVDKQTNKALQGVGFKVRVAASDGASDTASKDKYVAADGSLVAAGSAATFTTNASGTVTVPMLDAGTYVLEEAVVPQGYEKRPDIQLLVASTLDQSGMKVATLSVTPTTTDNTALDSDIVTTATANVNTGAVAVKTSDDKKVLMPITGMDGVTASLVYGGAAIALGLAGWVALRRKKQDDDVSEESAEA